VTADSPDYREGHEAFYITCSHLVVGSDSNELKYDDTDRIYSKLQATDLETIGTRQLLELVYPRVKIKDGWLTEQSDRRGLFDSSKAERLLGWKHDL
jgi:hypothetical protein